MAKMSKEEQEQLGIEWYDRTHKNWRAWGSWFSWGVTSRARVILYRSRCCNLDTESFGVSLEIAKTARHLSERFLFC